MAKVIKALAVVCTGGHTFVTLDPAKAKMHKENHDAAMHSCRPHRIVRMVDVTTLISVLREAMKKHGCSRKCDVCAWASQVIAMIWKAT
jgi:hypothetical protein